MATIIERPRVNKESTWQVQIRLPGHPTRSQSFDTKEKAQAFAHTAETKLRKTAGPSASRNARTFHKECFQTVILEYMTSSQCSEDNRLIAVTICKHIGAIATGDFKRKHLREYVSRMLLTDSSMGRPFMPSTIAKHISVMNKIYDWRAEELEADVPPSPFTTKVLPKGWDAGRERRLDKQEEYALIRETKAPRRRFRYHWRLLFRLALETGARQQELGLAQWREFDLQKGLWRIPAAHTKTKTNRIVALSPSAKRAVRALMLIRSPGDERLFHCFSSISSISAGFRKITAKADVVDFHFHDFRHESISRMIARRGSVSPFLIMKMVGHKSTEMLARYCNSTGDDIMGAFG